MIKQINVGVIGTGWCGGIRANACHLNPLVDKLYIAETNESRLNELKGKGHKVTLEEVQENLRLRDYDDTNREESPLKQADDAVVIDNTNLTKRDQLSMIVALAKERMVDEKTID